MLHQGAVVCCVCSLFAGCVGSSESPEDRFLSRGHYVLQSKDAAALEGPYTIKRILGPNRIVIESGGQDVRVTIRGCRPTDDEKMNLRARKSIGTLLGPDGVYIRTDCKQVIDKSAWKAVVYRTANKTAIVGENLELEKTVLTYAMPQLLNLAYGYSLLDTSDTDYPLYGVFKEAEQVARRNGNGYWATHSDK